MEVNLELARTEYLDKVATESGPIALRQYRYFLGALPDDVSPKGLDKWRTGLCASDLEPSSINRKLTAVRRFLYWLSRTEQIPTSATAIRDNLANFRAHKKRTDLPGQDAIRALLEAALQRPGKKGIAYTRFVCIGLFAGLRPGEITSLTARSLPEYKSYIQVTKTKTGIDRHVYYRHSQVLNAVLPKLRTWAGTLVDSGAIGWFTLAARDAGWGEASKRNTLRKLCVSYCACSRAFTEYELALQFGHSAQVSMDHYRDKSILDTINPGSTIEHWMGLPDGMAERLAEKCLESPYGRNTAPIQQPS